MELITDNPQVYEAPPSHQNRLRFKGEGVQLLGIMLFNWILTTFTLGLYYPWARVNKLRYIYGNTLLNETPFVFHGTGKELFKGFIKLFVFIVLWYGMLIYFSVTAPAERFIPLIFMGIFFLAFLFIVPLAIHGAFRYRLSRTSWSGIHLGYRGERGRLVSIYIGGLLLSIVTLGLYSSWFMHNMRKYVIGNCRFGSLRFGYSGEGSELFIINLKGFILTPLTLGIYYFWYQKEYLNYLIDFTYLEQDGKKFHFKGNIRGGSYFALTIVNLFLTLFTFGFGVPWVLVRTINFMINNVELPQQIDFANIAQTEDEYTDATGEDLLDYFDLGII